MDSKDMALTAKQVDGGRWKYGVPSPLRGSGYSKEFWTWSIRTYATRAAALRAGRGYFPVSAQRSIRVVG